MIEIQLSQQGKFKGLYTAIVSDEDHEIAKLRWSVLVPKNRSTMYAYRQEKETPSQYLHRMVMEAILDRPLLPGEHVDHIDGNGLNNQRDNLRLATRNQNLVNSKVNSRNKTGYKGVSWDNTNQKYTAHINHKKKQMNLGRFETALEAYQAYCEKAKELYGEFARLD